MLETPKFPLHSELAASEIILTEKFAVFLRTDNIVQLQIKDNLEYTVKDAIAVIAAIKKVSNGKLYPAMGIYGSFVSFSREGEKLMANHDETIADALVINNNLGIRIIAHFYIQFIKPKRPTQIFNDVDSALVWLKKYQ